MSVRISKGRLIEFLVFMMLFLSSSFTVTNNIIGSSTTILLWLITLFIIVLYCNFFHIPISVMSNSPLSICCILIACIWITDLFNRENLYTTGKNSFAFITVTLFIYVASFDEFKRSYINVLLFLSMISLICFFGYQLFPVLRELNLVKNTTGYLFSNIYIFVYNLSLARNCGMFWEPGAFGTFLCMAMLFELTRDNPRIKYVIVFLASIVTTFSTSAYIASLFIVLYYLFLKHRTKRRIRRLLLVLMAILVVGIFVNYDAFFGTYGSSTVFGKLFRYYQGSSHIRHTSTSIRVNAVIYGVIAFFSSPVIGHGYAGLRNLLYEYTLGMNTCTFVNWFSVYGFIFGILMIVGYYRLSCYSNKKKYHIGSLLLFMIFFVITISENYVNSPVFILLALYGYQIAGYKQMQKECEYV